MSTLDWQRIHKEAVIVDLHVHPSLQQQLFRRDLNLRYVLHRTFHGNPMEVRASFPRLRDGGFDVIFSTIYLPERGILKDFPLVRLFRFLRPDLWRKLVRTPHFEATQRFLDDMERAVSASSPDLVQVAASLPALEGVLARPKGQRPIAVVHAIEGGHSLGDWDVSDEDVLQHLETFHRRGVACLTLAHFYPNRIVHPTYPFPEDIARLAANPLLWRDLTLGLTPLGRRVVERMIELGMLIDLSHSTPVARRQVYEIAEASGKQVPLVASHVGAYGLNPTPYNLSDWEIRRIARDGGVIGVIFMPYWLMPVEGRQGLDAVSRHLQYLVDVGGEEAAAIGTDFDGFTTPPDDLDNASQMFRLVQRLVADGHPEARVRKILGENALRALRQGWGLRG